MPVYYVDIPVPKLKVNILKRRINKSHLYSMLSVVQESGIKYPVILLEKDTDIECLLGNTRIQVALMLKIPTISCLLLTHRYYKNLIQITSFDDFIDRSGLSKHEAVQGIIKPIS